MNPTDLNTTKKSIIGAIMPEGFHYKEAQTIRNSSDGTSFLIKILKESPGYDYVAIDTACSLTMHDQ